ncbi:MAG: extracellular solute-binding protein [Aristaeellaceae bacterium]
MKKRWFCLLLALTMTLSVMAPALADQFPLTTGNVTFTVFGQRDQNQANWDDVLVLNRYAEMTGVTMDWQEVPAQGYEEVKNLLFASNDLPDLFVRAQLNKNDVTLYGMNSGQLIPLNDLIAEYAPNLTALMEQYPSIRQAITSADGNIYTLPTVDVSATGLMGFKQWINKDWMEKLGLAYPTTTDELKEVLIAFRDQDPNGNGEKDEIPLGFREPSTIYVMGGSFGLEHQLGDTYNIDENGQIHNWLCDDEFKAYLMWLNDLYSEGLLWQEYYKNDRPLWRSNLSNALFGVFGMPYSDVFLAVEDQFTALPPMVGPYGDQLWADANTVGGQGAFAISCECENPELAIQWVDYFYSPEGSLFFRYGIEGETYYVDDEGQARMFDEILNAEEGFMTALGKINLVPGGGFPVMIDDQTDGIVASDLTKEVAAAFVPYLPRTVVAKPTVSMEDADLVNAIEQDLNTYRDTSVTKFILGEWSFDKWDEYCSTLETIGIRQLEEIYQKALDASN